jgi:hypothetical protein
MPAQHASVTARSALAAYVSVNRMEHAFRGRSASVRNLAGHELLIAELGHVLTAAAEAAVPFGHLLRNRGEDNGAYRQFTNAAKWLRKSRELADAAGLAVRRYVRSLQREGSEDGWDHAARQSAAFQSANVAAGSLAVLARELSAECRGSRISDAASVQEAIGHVCGITSDLDNALLVEAHLVEAAYTDAGAQRQSAEAFRALADAAFSARKAMACARRSA